MKVTYVDHMGNDLSPVNAARVSFNKTSDWVYCSGEREQGQSFCTDRCEETGEQCPTLKPADAKLLSYLSDHNHWSPFAHTSITLHVEAPLFVARQLAKHQVGFSWNEVSRRYVSEDPRFYLPSTWRRKAKNKKQGSAEESVEELLRFRFNNSETVTQAVEKFQTVAKDLYKELLDHGVCEEQARTVLPQSMYTEWYWTGSLVAWARMYKLRAAPDAQKEVQEVAQKVNEVIEPLFPVSWKVLKNAN